MKSLVTHNGYAHEDEFLASCLFLAKDPEIQHIVRNNGNELLGALKNNKKIYVVDVGKEYDPELNNYDHHQFEYGTFECSFSLALKKYNLYDIAQKSWDWLDKTIMWDCQGPQKVAAELNIDNAFQTLSGISVYFLKIFENIDHIDYNDYLFKTMKAIGEEIVNDLENMKRSFEWWGENTFITYLTKDIKGIFIKKESPVELYDSAMNKHIDFLREEGVEINIVGQPDSRSGGYKVFRVKDCPKIDFRLLNTLEKEKIHFIHNSGFLAVLNTQDYLEAMEISTRAIK